MANTITKRHAKDPHVRDGHTRLRVTIPQVLKSRMCAVAGFRGQTLSAYVQRALEQALAVDEHAS